MILSDKQLPSSNGLAGFSSNLARVWCQSPVCGSLDGFVLWPNGMLNQLDASHQIPCLLTAPVYEADQDCWASFQRYPWIVCRYSWTAPWVGGACASAALCGTVGGSGSEDQLESHRPRAFCHCEWCGWGDDWGDWREQSILWGLRWSCLHVPGAVCQETVQEESLLYVLVVNHECSLLERFLVMQR